MNAAAHLTEAVFVGMEKRGPAIHAIKYAADRFERNKGIRAFYRAAMPEIKAAPAHVWAIDIYEVDWPAYFTPIEAALWNDIRCEGAVLYPQFPVGQYFVDFGNPVAKVAIECDGKVHLQQQRADAERQAAIEAMGWTVFRLSGAQCNRDSTEHEDSDTGHVWYEESPGQELIRRVASEFRISGRASRSPA